MKALNEISVSTTGEGGIQGAAEVVDQGVQGGQYGKTRSGAGQLLVPNSNLGMLGG